MTGDVPASSYRDSPYHPAMLADWKRVGLAIVLGVTIHAVALPDPATVWSPWVTKTSLSLFSWLGLWLVPSVGLMLWMRLLSPEIDAGRKVGYLGIALSVAVYPLVHVLIWGVTVFGLVVVPAVVPAAPFTSLVSLSGTVAFSFLGIAFLEPVTKILATEYL